jgi:hypothetical protein
MTFKEWDLKNYPNQPNDIVAGIERGMRHKAWNAAIAAEREACANTVYEVLKFRSCMCCTHALNAIRSRKTNAYVVEKLASVIEEKHFSGLSESQIEVVDKELSKEAGLAARDQRIADLEAATRRLVEALTNYRLQHNICGADEAGIPICRCFDCESACAALADPVLVEMRRE